MSQEAELLRRYALEYDNEAFTALVGCTIDFVYAAALRQCRGNTTLAQEITQSVYTDLARRAKKLVAHPTLVGWLHTATRFAAMKAMRSESRRKLREQRAAEQQCLSAPDSFPVDWTQLQPVLDDAIGTLKERDREAILLRFFQGKSLLEIGTTLRLTETAARSCVDRALERLRTQLARHKITSTCAALGMALAQQSAPAAPIGLASAISGAALSGSVSVGTTLLPLLAMKKTIVTTLVLALAAEFAAARVELNLKHSLEEDSRQLENAQTKIAPAATQESGVGAMSLPQPVQSLTSEEAIELTRLEKRLAQLRSRPPGVIDSQLKSPRAVGRDTPQDAMQTLAAAVRDADWSALDRFVIFSDDTPENRAAFMANFSEAIRARYRTPERLMIAFSFDQVLHDRPVAQQILETHGYSGGVQTVTAWTQLASGFERKDTVPFEKTPDGWALSSLKLSGKDNPAIQMMRRRIDPMTGNVLPAK